MGILIAYASKHGSTREVADAVAASLEQQRVRALRGHARVVVLAVTRQLDATFACLRSLGRDGTSCLSRLLSSLLGAPSRVSSLER